MASFHQYLCRSNDRLIPSSDPGNCVLQMSSPISSGVYECVSAVLPNSQYNVNSTSNIILFSSSTGGSTVYSGAINSGNYTTSTISAGVTGAMYSADPTGSYACSYDNAVGKLTISSTGFTTRFRFASSTGNTSERVLGFIPSTDTSATGSYTLPNEVQLQPSGGLLINILEASSRISSSDGSEAGSLYFPLISTWGNYQVYSSGTYYPQYLKFNNDTRILTIQIRDSNNRLVSMNGSSWEFLLQKVSD